MGTRIHRNTSSEPLTTFLRRTMRSRQVVLPHYCPNLVAMATPLAPLKFSIAYLKSSTPRTPRYTQRLCRYLVHKWSYSYFWMFGIFTIAGIGNFIAYIAKNSGNYNFVKSNRKWALEFTETRLLSHWQRFYYERCDLDSEFCSILALFCQNWLPWHFPWLSQNFV